MNILFEGVNGSGKTTIINALTEKLEKMGLKYERISDLEANTPLNPVLKMMFADSVFLEMSKDFKTSLFESLVLAADHHYLQEMHRNDKGITLYDRDFISVLAYQKDIIKKDYPDGDVFFKSFREIMMYQLKDLDLLCYVNIPIEENIKRTETRDKRKFSEEEKESIKSLKNNMEEEINNYCESSKTPLLVLDGRKNPEQNANEIIMHMFGKKKSNTTRITKESDKILETKANEPVKENEIVKDDSITEGR